MHLVVLGNAVLKNALLAQVPNPTIEITWVADVQQLMNYSGADAYLDLLFENNPERIQLLKSLGASVIINSVTDTLEETDAGFIRINGWPGFLHTSLVEASGNNEGSKTLTEHIFQQLGKTICWVPDQVGFVTPRVVSAIINEGYFALQEEVSTKEEINTAMKLGTNYPYGPFEWAAITGLPAIYQLLQKLSVAQARYQPSSLLVSEAGSS
jgi:3-hydroxybutyryl-CoA dehydrogenase